MWEEAEFEKYQFLFGEGIRTIWNSNESKKKNRQLKYRFKMGF